jgi:hypothetical protein
MFNNVLNWKLLPGSHKFPGEDGGTCITEAAIVAAGFGYRTIRSAADCPPCFSRVVVRYAIAMNDVFPDKYRQELLLPFVMRLAGTADTPDIEGDRQDHITLQTLKRILPFSLMDYLVEDAQKLLGAVSSMEEFYDSVVGSRQYVLKSDIKQSARLLLCPRLDEVSCEAQAIAFTKYVAKMRERPEVYTIAASILDEIIRLGKNSDINFAIASTRLEKQRELCHV